MGRPKEHDEATRERLLDAAEQMSASEGWAGLTVRGVAEQAGTSTRAVYALFSSKEGLEQALHQEMFSRLRDLLRDTPRSADPRRDLVAMALGYRRWATERPQRYAVAMHSFLGPYSRPRSEEGLAIARAALDELRQVVIRNRDAGLMGGRDVEEVLVEVRALTHGLAEFENLGLLGPEPEPFWTSAVSTLLDGYADSARAAA